MKSISLVSLIIAFSFLLSILPSSAATPGEMGLSENSGILQTAFDDADDGTITTTDDDGVQIEIVPTTPPDDANQE